MADGPGAAEDLLAEPQMRATATVSASATASASASVCKIDLSVMNQLGSQFLPSDGKAEASHQPPCDMSLQTSSISNLVTSSKEEYTRAQHHVHSARSSRQTPCSLVRFAICSARR